MKISQSNYWNMMNAVLALFCDNADAWTNIRVLSDGVGRLRESSMAIRETVTKQSENNHAGNSAAKERARETLEDSVYQIALRLRSYARMNNDDILAEKVHFSRSELDHLGANDLLTRSRVVLDVCVAKIPDLVDYQINPSTVGSLVCDIDHIAQLYTRNDNIVDQRMEATMHMEQLFAQARKQLKALDDLVEGFVADDEFVVAYFNARRIHDLKGRHPSKNEDSSS